MSIVRRSRTDIDDTKLLAELANTPDATESEINAMAVEDDSVLTDEHLATAVRVYPVHTPEQMRQMRNRLGLSQAQFARQFGLTLDTVQQYEQGRRRPVSFRGFFGPMHPGHHRVGQGTLRPTFLRTMSGGRF